MKNSGSHLILTASVISLAIIGAVFLATWERPGQPAPPTVAVEAAQPVTAVPQVPAEEATMAASAGTTIREAGTSEAAAMPLQPVQPPKQESPVVSRMNAVPSAAAAKPSGGKEPARDPMARLALFFVGADPDAEAYWYEAINDTRLSEHERQDLIEDLNEDGLTDPKHPTEEDLPLILTRLLIIEAIAPDAVDQVNADAFQEAYKDLVNLAQLVIGGGQPVR